MGGGHENSSSASRIRFLLAIESCNPTWLGEPRATDVFSLQTPVNQQISSLIQAAILNMKNTSNDYIFQTAFILFKIKAFRDIRRSPIYV